MGVSFTVGVSLLCLLSGFVITAEGHAEEVECVIAFGKEPNPEDDACETFTECMDYVGVVQKCDGGKQFDFTQLRCRKDEDVWCQDQLETLRAETNETSAEEEATTQQPVTTTEEQTTTAEPATTTVAPEETTAAAGRARSGRWTALLRARFPQLFNGQGGAAAAAPAIGQRAGLAPNNAGWAAGQLPRQLPVLPAAIAGGPLAAGNILPALGRNLVRANSRSANALGGANASPFAPGNILPYLTRNRAARAQIQSQRRPAPTAGVRHRINAGQNLTTDNSGAPTEPTKNVRTINVGNNLYSTDIVRGQNNTNVNPVSGADSQSTFVNRDESVTLTLNGDLGGPVMSAPRQDQNISWNNIVPSASFGSIGAVQNSRNSGLAYRSKHSNASLTLTSAVAVPNIVNSGDTVYLPSTFNFAAGRSPQVSRSKRSLANRNFPEDDNNLTSTHTPSLSGHQNKVKVRNEERPIITGNDANNVNRNGLSSPGTTNSGDAPQSNSGVLNESNNSKNAMHANHQGNTKPTNDVPSSLSARRRCARAANGNTALSRTANNNVNQNVLLSPNSAGANQVNWRYSDVNINSPSTANGMHASGNGNPQLARNVPLYMYDDTVENVVKGNTPLSRSNSISVIENAPLQNRNSLSVDNAFNNGMHAIDVGNPQTIDGNVPAIQVGRVSAADVNSHMTRTAANTIYANVRYSPNSLGTRETSVYNRNSLAEGDKGNGQLTGNGPLSTNWAARGASGNIPLTRSSLENYNVNQNALFNSNPSSIGNSPSSNGIHVHATNNGNFQVASNDPLPLDMSLEVANENILLNGPSANEGNSEMRGKPPPNSKSNAQAADDGPDNDEMHAIYDDYRQGIAPRAQNWIAPRRA